MRWIDLGTLTPCKYSMLHVRLGLKLTSSNKGHGNLWLSEPCTCRVTVRYCRLMDCVAHCVNTCKSTCHYFVSVKLVRIAHVLQGMKLSASTNKMTGGLFPFLVHEMSANIMPRYSTTASFVGSVKLLFWFAAQVPFGKRKGHGRKGGGRRQQE